MFGEDEAGSKRRPKLPGGYRPRATDAARKSWKPSVAASSGSGAAAPAAVFIGAEEYLKLQRAEIAAAGKASHERQVESAFVLCDDIVARQLANLADNVAHGFFAGLDGGQRELRINCIKERICLAARQRYHDAVNDLPAAWAQKWKTPDGKTEESIARFVERFLKKASHNNSKFPSR